MAHGSRLMAHGQSNWMKCFAFGFNCSGSVRILKKASGISHLTNAKLLVVPHQGLVDNHQGSCESHMTVYDCLMTCRCLSQNRYGLYIYITDKANYFSSFINRFEQYYGRSRTAGRSKWLLEHASEPQGRSK